MEILEDAFEALHQQAEAVRAIMRTRSAGLAMAQATRRGVHGDAIEARLGTPASQTGTTSRGQWDGIAYRPWRICHDESAMTRRLRESSDPPFH